MEVGQDTGEPFLIYRYNLYYYDIETTISITTTVENIHKLDSKYLDLPTNLATTDDVQEAVDLANNKMDKSNPVGTGSFSMNRKSGTTIGSSSTTIGYNNTASGQYSHAEGCNTHATITTSTTPYTTSNINAGYAAHAEGYGTVASGAMSHAEGNGTKASGIMSHAEGNQTNASAASSHAEGYNTITHGNDSHAEGRDTKTFGYNSHAEGLGTNAQKKSQHVQGEYNILDTTGTNITRGQYAHIVGNGTSETARSNAHTLDWNGVGWFQGGLQVGGTAQDGEGVLYVPAVPATAQVGQLLSVKAVDENGKPTEWEAVDFPSEEWEVIFGPEYVNGSGASCVTEVEAEGTTKVTQALGAYYKKLYVRLNGQADAFCTSGNVKLCWDAANANWHNLQEQKGTATWTDLWWIVEFCGAFIQVRTAAGNTIQNRRTAGAKYDKTNNLVLTTTTSGATFHNFSMEIWGVKA